MARTPQKKIWCLDGESGAQFAGAPGIIPAHLGRDGVSRVLVLGRKVVRASSGVAEVERACKVWRGSGGVLGASRAPDSVAAATVPPFGRCARVTSGRRRARASSLSRTPGSSARARPHPPHASPPARLSVAWRFNVHPSIRCRVHRSPNSRDAKPHPTPHNETSTTPKQHKHYTKELVSPSTGTAGLAARSLLGHLEKPADQSIAHDP